MNLSQIQRVPLPVWYGLAVVVGGLAAWYAVKKTAGTVVDALDNGALDVTSENNLAYRATNQVGHWFFGLDKNATIGTALYDLLHDDYDPNAPEPAATLPGHTKSGSVWYGYDRQKANEAAFIGANSQIAKDIQKYGGGYGALTK